ncbi:hypothetical protein M2324_002045 [Rhodovulum sulfidophilum]|nr:hypothetical protein [Rhodovulum sulfidophilum]
MPMAAETGADVARADRIRNVSRMGSDHGHPRRPRSHGTPSALRGQTGHPGRLSEMSGWHILPTSLQIGRSGQPVANAGFCLIFILYQ